MRYWLLICSLAVAVSVSDCVALLTRSMRRVIPRLLAIE
jgi:hypothetical protein